MKKAISLIFITTCFVISIFGQNDLEKLDDLSRISILAVVPEQAEGLPKSAENVLKNKLRQIVTKNGLGSTALLPQFIITASLDVLSKDITATTPPMIALNLGANIYIIDYVNKNIVGSEYLEIKGAGKNETKAYIQGIKRISTSSDEMKRLVKKAKEKIVEYYNTKCDFIIKEAETLAKQRKYEEAIYKLTSVPDACKDCYMMCMDAVEPIYKEFLDYQCEKYLTKAKTVWASNQTFKGAQEAGKWLAWIDPDAKCRDKALKMVETMKAKVLKDEGRDWNFMLKAFDTNKSIEEQRIDAYRAVGIAYGTNQPEVQYNIKEIIR